jgi:hypothetical protein
VGQEIELGMSRVFRHIFFREERAEEKNHAIAFVLREIEWGKSKVGQEKNMKDNMIH